MPLQVNAMSISLCRFRCVRILIAAIAVLNIVLLLFSHPFSKTNQQEQELQNSIKSEWANVPPHQQAAYNLHVANSKFHAHILAEKNIVTTEKFVRGGGRVSNNLFLSQRAMEKPFTFKTITSEDNSAFPLFPDEDYTKQSDRIVNQMRYVPKQITNKNESGVKRKIILLYNGLGSERPGTEYFIRNNCPVKDCQLIGDRSKSKDADIIIWQHSLSSLPFHQRPARQVWATFMLESPFHTPLSGRFASQINWTATYRHDSTIVAPYFKFVPYDNVNSKLEQPKFNYAKTKSKMVAWFVSNCGARNRRLEYAKSLANYISVDMYGGCGKLKCSRSSTHECFKMLREDYRFYLSFENSNCRDYITEKFFLNALQNNVIPIVMGAHPDDYKRQAPPNSFIHVDDFESPKHLANYLNYLVKNETAYNSYFAWKGYGLVDTNTFFFCRVCALIHEVDNQPGISRTVNVNEFWSSKKNCIRDKWGKDLPL